MNRRLFPAEVRVAQLPKPPAPPITADAFCLVPVACLPGLTVDQLLLQQWIYLRAFEQAQAVVQPSLPERDLLGVWN
jgi:hypothetical protein